MRRLRRLPSAAEGLIESDEIERRGSLALGDRILRVVQRALGVEHTQEIREPLSIEPTEPTCERGDLLVRGNRVVPDGRMTFCAFTAFDTSIGDRPLAKRAS